jgi:hypothetical protein
LYHGLPFSLENETKDHLKENVRRLREIQRSARQKTDVETNQPVKALWKLAQFDGVESKVKEELQVLHQMLTSVVDDNLIWRSS